MNPTNETLGQTGTTASPGRESGPGRGRFLRACAGQPADGTPIWLMRQAGRVLPEYRALKERYSFLELVRTPDLAAEVTLQPIRRFGFDAAIIFSDILVIPEAMGLPYHFRDTGGVVMEGRINDAADVDRLVPGRAAERLRYVADALRLVRRELGGRTALIGFAGSPWTLANFMIEGGSSREFRRAHAMFRDARAVYDRLAERLVAATLDYLNLQVEAGAEVVQLFDTLGGLLPAEDFEAASGRWLTEIVRGLRRRVPVIVFSKGARSGLPALVSTGADVLGFDGSADLGAVREALPASVGIQGNLEPAVLESTPAEVRRETIRILGLMRGRAGHIFNLGHGVPPTAPLENLAVLVETVRSGA